MVREKMSHFSYLESSAVRFHKNQLKEVEKTLAEHPSKQLQETS